MDTQNLIDIKEAADIAGTTRHTVHRWIRERGLATVRVASFQLIDRAELDRFLTETSDWRKESLTITRRTGRAA